MSATRERTRCRGCCKFVQTEHEWVTVEEFPGDIVGKSVKTNRVRPWSYCEPCGDWAVSREEQRADDLLYGGARAPW